MNNVQKFFSKNGYIIICIFLGLILIQMCSQKSTNKSIKKEINIIRKTDSINNNNIIKSLKIEGLKSEKRMIQATDRKILDVQRQNEIEKEIRIAMALICIFMKLLNISSILIVSSIGTYFKIAHAAIAGIPAIESLLACFFSGRVVK